MWLLTLGALQAQVLELSYTDRSVLTWNDVGSGANSNGSFWASSIPGGLNIFALGHLAVAGYGQPAGM